MRKNAALEASNVAVLLEHIPVGQTRSVHSLQVTRVEPDHYSIGGGRVIDLVDAISQIGQYSGHGAVNMRSNPAMDEASMRNVLGKVEAHLEHINSMGDRALAEQASEVDDFFVPMMDDLEHIAQQTAGAKTQAKRAMHKKATDLWNDLYYIVHTEIPRAQSRLSERAADVYETHDREQYGMRSNPMAKPQAIEDQAKSAYMRAEALLPQLKNATYKQEGFIAEIWHPIIDDLEDAARSKRIDPKVKRSAAAMLTKVLQAVDMYDLLPSESAARGIDEEYLEPYMRVGQRRNPWDQPRAAAKAAELQRMQRLLEKREAKKAAQSPLRSNPQKAERGYFYEVMDKRGDVVMLTTTKAEAQDICANPAEYKLRKGGTFTFRHIGAQSALEGPPIRRI